MKIFIAVVSILILFSCKSDEKVRVEENDKKLDIYFEEFGISINSKKLDNIQTFPHNYGVILNNGDSVMIILEDFKGKSSYSRFRKGELIENGYYHSSLGMLANYIYIDHNVIGGKDSLEYVLHKFYQPILKESKVFNDIQNTLIIDSSDLNPAPNNQ